MVDSPASREPALPLSFVAMLDALGSRSAGIAESERILRVVTDLLSHPALGAGGVDGIVRALTGAAGFSGPLAFRIFIRLIL